MSDDKPTVRVKPHSHQPSKAELEEPVIIRKPDGSVPTPEELARVALRPMKVIEDPEA
ncbi:MAG: hypothetical protein OXP11_02895 [Gammaproteobacteria bacterium]|nr:hypothetical protein [Gammaproteobacteria bacterium]